MLVLEPVFSCRLTKTFIDVIHMLFIITIKLDSEDIRIPGAKIVYDSIYMVQRSLYLSKFMLIPIEAQDEESYKYTLPCRSLYYAYRLIADQKIILSAFKNPFTVTF